jgi:hypothetical protein
VSRAVICKASQILSSGHSSRTLFFSPRLLLSSFLLRSSFFFFLFPLLLCSSAMATHLKPRDPVITKLNGPLKERRHSKSQSAFNYDNTSSNLAATTMRNELKKLIDTAPPGHREVISPQSHRSNLLTTSIHTISAALMHGIAELPL